MSHPTIETTDDDTPYQVTIHYRQRTKKISCPFKAQDRSNWHWTVCEDTTEIGHGLDLHLDGAREAALDFLARYLDGTVSAMPEFTIKDYPGLTLSLVWTTDADTWAWSVDDEAWDQIASDEGCATAADAWYAGIQYLM